MDAAKRHKPTINSTIHSTAGNSKAHVNEAMSDLLHEGKKYAHELYEEGLVKVSETEKELEKYSEELITKVRENPLKSILIAGGVGFLLSALLRK